MILQTPHTPRHVAVAAAEIGLHEIVGVVNNPTILGWAKSLGWDGIFTSDEVPWCGLFAAWALHTAGATYPAQGYRALAWESYGNPCAQPHYGSIAVLKRKGGGHVAFVVGQITIAGELHLVLLGGNQGNAVSQITVKPSDIYALRSVPSSDIDAPLPDYNPAMLAAGKVQTGGVYA